MWAGQSAQEVKVNGTERSYDPVRAAAENQLLCDGQTGGLTHLRGGEGRRLFDCAHVKIADVCC